MEDVKKAEDASSVIENKLTDKQIKKNLILMILMDSIFSMGAIDLQIVMQPLWKYLHATNTQIGMVGTWSMLSLIPIFLSPYISNKCRYKKLYLFFSHVPYIGTWGIMAFILFKTHSWNISSHTLLFLTIALSVATNVFGGFVNLPHQEYISNCIPMRLRGRLNGIGGTVGGSLSLASSAIGMWVLTVVAKPMAFGYLYLMTWFICQTGYIFALFGKEIPTPIENAPKPYTKEMFVDFWRDKRFLRVLIMWIVLNFFFGSIINTFIIQYGLRDFNLPDATSAAIAMTMQITSTCCGALIGVFVDKIRPKRTAQIVPYWGAFALLPILIFPCKISVFVTMGIFATYNTMLYASYFSLLYGIPKPEHRSGHYTILTFVSMIASNAGLAVMGVLCDKLGYSGTFILVFFVAICIGIFGNKLLSPLSSNPEDYSTV